MKKAVLVLSLLALILVTAACQEKELPQPQAITELDQCEVCHMMVPDDYNTTQIILENGRVLKFDDIGCMFEWEKTHGDDDIAVRYVRDYLTEEWIVLEEAVFAYDSSFVTAMAYNVLSFKHQDEAEQFIEEQGTGVLLTVDDLYNHHWERNMEMMKQLKQEHGHTDHKHGEHGEMMEKKHQDEHHDHSHSHDHDEPNEHDAHDHDDDHEDQN
ncbi:hypothetical protein GCM10010965_19750 [Caldalkalibacillus thermarum]|uniref:nitrous oxide reductase accessory protein NosL n=1 Tax=Caldalkalibacillus thermarum TaxID=296745 RepID=UPI00166A6D7D|nr:nitrous oxide reductase accessory protein NosL [Caldalkalibacillus thermarum]GGK27021.1 hypothetical protein GCM10010965_19750 [Caldalkalibacillus thermarum]